MGGPYRTRLFRPPSFEPFWEMVERRKRLRKAIPATIVVLALLPGVATGVAKLIHPAPPVRSERAALGRVLVDPRADAWGLVVDPEGASPWVGPLPVGAERPDREASPIPLADLQRTLATQAASQLSACYGLTERYSPGLEGDLVLHLAVRGQHVRMMLSGRRELREALAGCVDRAFEGVKLPESREVSWVHFPLRFTQFVPVGRRRAT